jgi:hypothetical protein
VAIIKVPRFKQVASRESTAAAQSPDGLDAFDTETIGLRAEDQLVKAPPVLEVHKARSERGPWFIASIVLGSLLLGGVAAGGAWAYRGFPLTPPTASLALQTTPPGTQVTINGEAKGSTPVALTLAAGTYQVKLAGPSGQERTFDLTLKAGESVTQQIEWSMTPPPVNAETGGISIQTEPAGQAVFVDDVRRGTSPLTVNDLTPGEHQLVVSSESGTFRRAVTVTAGETLSVVVAPRAPAVSAGFLRVTSPVVLQLRANGDLIGNTESARLMLPAGEHEIQMSNDQLAFTRTQRVTVAAGRTADVRVTLPNGTLSINAVPWAEVFINGERLGETPLANISRPIGTYRVVFRHPQFGDREASVTVTAKGTARLGVDMRERQQE